MTDTGFRPKAYIKKACPYCTKLRIGLTEIGVANKFDFIIVDNDDESLQAARSKLEAAGLKPSFPTVEVAPGEYIAESDDLINRYAAEAGVDPASLSLLAYYKEGVMQSLGRLWRENRELKEKLEPA